MRIDGITISIAFLIALSPLANAEESYDPGAEEVLYGVDVAIDTLLILDKSTAAVAAVGTVGTPVVGALAFGPSGASIAHFNSHMEDTNLDGLMDLVVHFETRDTGIVWGDESATLTGLTLDGQAFEGSDSVQTVGCRGGRRSLFDRPGEDRLIQSRGGDATTPQRK